MTRTARRICSAGSPSGRSRPSRPGEPHVVTGWRLGREGRKMLAGSALFTAGGDLAALGVATWIQLS